MMPQYIRLSLTNYKWEYTFTSSEFFSDYVKLKTPLVWKDAIKVCSCYSANITNDICSYSNASRKPENLTFYWTPYFRTTKLILRK